MTYFLDNELKLVAATGTGSLKEAGLPQGNNNAPGWLEPFMRAARQRYGNTPVLIDMVRLSNLVTTAMEADTPASHPDDIPSQPDKESSQPDYTTLQPDKTVSRARQTASQTDQNASQSEDVDCGQLLDRSRVNWMGTDGIRGKTTTRSARPAPGERSRHDDTPARECAGIGVFRSIRNGELPPVIVEYAAAACARLFLGSGSLRPGDRVCVANDGRDRAAEGRYDRAMKAGFVRAGLKPFDLGVIPTPFVPHCMLERGIRLGAMLTASHNPANQNGIKFFFEGRKILPEGELGEFTLSALMYREAMEKEKTQTAVPEGTTGIETLDWNPSAKAFLSAAVGNSRVAAIRRLLGDLPLVVDTANGAAHRLSREWLAEAGIATVCVNPEPDGANINRECGVAQIEGLEYIDTPEKAAGIPAAEELYRLGRGSGDGAIRREAWAIVLDGDGDRGFLLRYEAESDRIRVLDGDSEGVLIARDFAARVTGNPGTAVFTVESDIMAVAAAERAGFTTATVGVGDRWIGAFESPSDQTRLAVGIESSGHVIVPHHAGYGELRAGNGLLTGLLALAAAAIRKRDGQAFAYERGFSKTWYAWFVDKTRFYRESAIWKEDVDTVSDALETWKRAKECEPGAPGAFTVEIENKGDPDLLFWAIRQRGTLVATLFTRNSGTEDKNAVYLKCRPDLAEGLIPVAESLASRHARLLRDETNPGARLSNAVTRLLGDSGPLSSASLAERLAREKYPARREELHAVLHALCRERRISIIEGIDHEHVWTL